MRVVVGIDPSQTSENLTHLLSRLSFHQAEATYASFAPCPTVPPPSFAQTADELMQEQVEKHRSVAYDAMLAAAGRLTGKLTGQNLVFELGEPSAELSELADREGAELIAIGTRDDSELNNSSKPSIGRCLTIHSGKSVLIAKGEVKPKGAIKAVFAYDASPCCERSIDRLIKICPLGITHIDLVIADTPDPRSSPVTALRGEGAWHLGPESRTDLLWSYACSAAERLTGAGYQVRPLCMSGDLPTVVRTAVANIGADLVILGAQGHGFLERALFGSSALAQVVSEPHSLLILRPVSLS